MKRCLLLILMLAGISAGAVQVDRTEPPFWYVGMKNHEVQVMFHGPGIALAECSLAPYPGVSVKELARVDNPNYLFVYLDVAEGTAPGTLQFTFKEGRKKVVRPFELRERNGKTGAQGFSAADVLYLIMPDRFANGDPGNDTLESWGVDRSNGGGHHGGDLQGIRDHLDYLEALGVTAVWLNPVQFNRGNASHGYAISDYYAVDPRLGGNEAYVDFIDAAHGKGLKVVMDMIFNHCGSSHWWLTDIPDGDWFNQNEVARKVGETASRPQPRPQQGQRGPGGWRRLEGLQTTTHYKWALMDPHAPQSEKDVLVDGWFSGGMPDLNQRNRHLATYLIQNSIWWIEYARIDGIRMDTYPYADYDFMVRWCREVEEEYPDFNIVGEGWYPRNSAAGWWQAGSAFNPSDSRLKTVMDFDLTFTAKREMLRESNTSEGSEAGLFKLYECIAQDFLIPDPSHVLTFLDNHDIARFMEPGEPAWKLKQGLAFLLTTRGIPQIYYGTEIAMGGREALRADFPGGWAEDPRSAFTAEGRTPYENECWDFASKLLRWRRTSGPVARGELIHYTPDNATKCYVYARRDDANTVLVILNGSDREQTVPMERFREVVGGCTAGVDAVTGEVVDVTAPVKIAPRGVYVLDLTTGVTSPDGRIAVRFGLSREGVPSYGVHVDGKALVEPSVMGLQSEEVNLDRGFSLVCSRVSEHQETWTQPWGENKEIEDAHRELSLTLKNDAGVGLEVVFRVFDDGVGFRYRYEVPCDTLTIAGERTQFAFASDAESWSIPGDFNSYEHLYRRMPLSELRDANTPLTLKFSDSLYAAVHEAAIVDFPEMVLRHDAGLTYRAALSPLRQVRRRGGGGQARGPVAVVPGRFQTPWRTLQVARKAVDLVNSSLILNLNEPCALADVSWIRPMKYVGVWWGMHLGVESWGGEGHGATTEQALRYIDFAAANNIQGVLFEGWNDAWRGSDALPDFDFTRAAPDYDVERVARYARSKGISLITHNETGGNYLRFEEQLDRVLDWDASLGIHAMKTGYAGGGLSGGAPRHSQTGVAHFQKVVEEAARRQIMVDAHETIKASGLRRTWPNFMTRECVRGMEYNGWGPGNPPSHTVTLPYTRLLGGPVDYTPGVFDILYQSIQDRPQLRTWGQPGTQCREHTTLAKQIANWVILYSPMQMACDLLENYEGHPAFQFFRDFEADCDASEALQGEVGEWIAVVRRAGDRFFLGASTDETGRTVDQPLTFLRPGVRYTATVYGDAPDAHWESNPTAYRITTRTVTSADTLSLRLAPGGGAAVTFLPE